MINMSDAKAVAGELHQRYAPVRAVVLVSRSLQRALFAGRSDDVVFWALVHAHYRNDDLDGEVEKQLAALLGTIIRDPSERN